MTPSDTEPVAASAAGSLPGGELPNAEAALRRAIVSGARVRAAVAFVTVPGVDLLANIIKPLEDVQLEIAARAADATQPEALIKLRDTLGADVDVVIGKDYRRFHPKLWLVETEHTLTVLSGSGNLTAGGLVHNEEQFELFQVPSGTAEADRQHERFEALTSRVRPLDEVEGSREWKDWLRIIDWRSKDPGVRRLRELEDRLNTREVAASRTGHRNLLVGDLRNLHDRIVAAGLPRREGGPYRPSRFLQQINRVEKEAGDPVVLVARICRRATDGYDIIASADRRDLTIESLVVDATKPYHDLFSEATRELCRERLAAQFGELEPEPEPVAAFERGAHAESVFAQLRRHMPHVAGSSKALFDALLPHAGELVDNPRSVTLVLGEGSGTVRLAFYDGRGPSAGNSADGRGPVYIDWRSFRSLRSSDRNEELAQLLETLPVLAPQVASARTASWWTDIGLGPVLGDAAQRDSLVSIVLAACGPDGRRPRAE